MFDHHLLKGNPRLHVFIPVLYIIWSDALLTPTELTSQQKLIQDQSWLTNQEKEFLLQYVNPRYTPSSEELRSWLSEIRKVAEVNDTLDRIGIKLAQLHGVDEFEDDSLTRLQESMRAIESELGLITVESAYHFHRRRSKT